MAIDPTYQMEIINANPIWKLAFWISEITNDNAPLGWHKYIFLATCILNKYELKEKENENG